MVELNRKNHFERFDLDEDYNIDLDELEESYLGFQQKFHPDKLKSKSKEEQINLEHNSLLVNESYEILKNPLKRLNYLLKLRADIDINSDQRKVNPDQETLIENLELRELIFETSNKEKLNDIKRSCQKEIKIILTKAKELFLKSNYEECGAELIKAKYLEKSLIEIKKKK
jgi:molecular chaperone HscB